MGHRFSRHQHDAKRYLALVLTERNSHPNGLSRVDFHWRYWHIHYWRSSYWRPERSNTLAWCCLHTSWGGLAKDGMTEPGLKKTSVKKEDFQILGGPLPFQ